MNIYLTPTYITSFKKLTKNNPLLIEKIKRKIYQFSQNRLYPGLKLHKLTGHLHNSWSFSVTEDIRIIFGYKDSNIVFTDIGKHEDVY